MATGETVQQRFLDFSRFSLRSLPWAQGSLGRSQANLRQNSNPCTGSSILGSLVLGFSVLGLRILSPRIEDPQSWDYGSLVLGLRILSPRIEDP